MAAVCLDASIETLRPLCYRGTHCLQGDLCRRLHEGSLHTVQVVVTLLTSHVLQNSPQFSVPGVEVWTPRGPILAADKGRNIPPQQLLRRLGFWAGTGSCWKTHSWPLKRVMLTCFITPCSTSCWYTRTPVSPLSCKNEDVSPADGAPPIKPWRRKGDGIPAPSECTSWDAWAQILLFWLLYCSSSMVNNFLSVKRMFSCPFSACHWRRRSALIRRISFSAGVRMCPFERRCALMSRSSLMRHDLIGSVCSALGTWSAVSRADFGQSAPVLFW